MVLIIYTIVAQKNVGESIVVFGFHISINRIQPPSPPLKITGFV